MAVVNVPRKVRPLGFLLVSETPERVRALIDVARRERTDSVVLTEVREGQQPVEFTVKHSLISSVETEEQHAGSTPGSDLPNLWDWDTNEEYAEAGERLKRWRRDVEGLHEHPDLQSPEDQRAIRRELDSVERAVRHWSASRRRRQDFQRRGLIPPD